MTRETRAKRQGRHVRQVSIRHVRHEPEASKSQVSRCQIDTCDTREKRGNHQGSRCQIYT